MPLAETGTGEATSVTVDVDSSMPLTVVLSEEVELTLAPLASPPRVMVTVGVTIFIVGNGFTLPLTVTVGVTVSVAGPTAELDLPTVTVGVIVIVTGASDFEAAAVKTADVEAVLNMDSLTVETLIITAEDESGL